MTVLWSDERISKLSGPIYNSDPVMDVAWVKDMRNDYERALSFRNETIGNLQGELRNMQARNAELEAQLQALGVVVDGQNRQLKAVYLTRMVQAQDEDVQP